MGNTNMKELSTEQVELIGGGFAYSEGSGWGVATGIYASGDSGDSWWRIAIAGALLAQAPAALE